MRVTFNYINMVMMGNIQSSLKQTLNASEEVIKGRNLLTPETDPTRYISAMNVQRAVNDTLLFRSNGEEAQSWLRMADDTLLSVMGLVTKAKNEYAVNGANGTNNSESLQALANDVLGVYETVLGFANSQYKGRSLFGGYQTESDPFVVSNNAVSAVMSSGGRGGDITANTVYHDMEELTSGKYRLEAEVIGDVMELRLYDSNNNPVLIDSNGSDETLSSGNNATNVMRIEYKPNAVVNLGVGVSVVMPSENTGSLNLSFNYTSGSNISYIGDGNEIFTTVGYNQSIALNVSGEDVFLKTYKSLKSTRYNSTYSMPITKNTYFSKIDGANLGLSSYINFSGTDHNGYPVGNAKVMSPQKVSLALENASDSERTVTVEYANKYYNVTVPANNYKDMAELTSAINDSLKTAVYAGSVKDGAPQDFDPSQYGVDISGEIEVVADGDHLTFMTNTAGNYVSLSVTGSKHNKLGFDGVSDFNLYRSYGKDTVFDMSYTNWTPEPNDYLETVHTDMDFTNQPTYFYVNGELVEAYVPPGSTGREIGYILDEALKGAGFGFEVSAHVTTAAGTLDVTFTNQNISYTSDTVLSVKTDSEYTTTAPRGGDYPYALEKRVGDMLNFIEDLYDGGVRADIVDGQITVTDIRSGNSKMSFYMDENYNGIGHAPGNPYNVVSGTYSGSVDSTWDIQVRVDAPSAGVREVYVTVRDERGNLIADKSVLDYRGGPIDIGYGVSIVPEENLSSAQIAAGPGFPYVGSTSNFQVELKANSSLGFGSMNVVESGSNVSVFHSLENLHKALLFDINEAGISEPSAWKDTAFLSTASPYFDGEYRGNSNNLWNFEAVSGIGGYNPYVQFEQFNKLTSFNAHPSMIGNMDLSVEIYDNDAGEFKRVVLSDAVGTFEGNGKTYATGAPALTYGAATPVNFDVYNKTTGVVDNLSINIPAGNYADEDALVAEINNQLAIAGFDANIGASVSDGRVVFYSKDQSVYGNIFVDSQDLGFSSLSTQMQDVLLEAVNENEELHKLGVYAEFDTSGNIKVLSGSGSKQISILSNNQYTTYALDTTATPLKGTIAPNLEFAAPVDLTFHYNTGGVWSAETITVPAGVYADTTALMAAIDVEIAANATLAGNVTVALDGSNLNFTVDPAFADISYIAGDQYAQLGFPQLDADMQQAHTVALLSMADLSAEERSLSFKYDDGTGLKEVTITVDARDYDSIDELIAEIDSKMTGDVATYFDIIKTGEDNFSFNGTSGIYTMVEGDYAGTLGFYKAGNSATFKVTGSDGELVNIVTIDTANRTEAVADGIVLGLDAGLIRISDSFDAGVGSGIQHEIGTLDAAEGQVLNAITTVGARYAQVESIIAFSHTTETTYEGFKHMYLGAREQDRIMSETNYMTARETYQKALQAASGMLNMSLMDYLR